MRRRVDAPFPRAQEVHIRPMALGDLDTVLEVQKRAFAHPWSAELFRREMDHDWSTILVAEAPIDGGGRAIAGFLIFWLVHDELHVLNLGTDPVHRRQGIARRLLEVAFEQGRAHKCVLATLEVRKSNEAAIALYGAYGFRQVGVRPNYYVDEREDAIVMVADL